MSYTNNHYIEANAVQRVAHLPLFDSALKSVVSVYTDVKGRYPLLGVVGGVAEIGVRNVSQAAILRATPLLLSLEPQIEVVNNYACMGLDQLENNFPVLHQSTEEVLGHLKDAFFLTLDDVQLRVNDELDRMQEHWDKLTNATWYYLLALQESQLGQMATSGLDDILTRSEEAMAKYMPLTPALRLEWERRTQQYEDEDGNDEPGLWTRFRGLLLFLSLQLYHRLLKLRNRLEWAMGMLQDATDRMGLSSLLEVVGFVLQRLQLFYVSQVLRLEAVRRLALDQLKAQVRFLAELGPVKQLLGLPAQVQLVVVDLQELGKILLQLLVNSTPLYNMLQQPSDQDVEDFLNQQDSMSSDTTRHSSANSLFLKAMDGRPHKRKSSYARSQRGSSSAPSPASDKSSNGSRGSQKQDDQTLSLELDPLELPSTSTMHRPSSAAEVLLGSILQYLSSEPSRWTSSSDVAPKVETTEDLSPEQGSDEAVTLEVESTEYYSDARDVSPSRRKSLSARSRRCSSNAGKPNDQPLSRRGSQKPDDQPLSRRGSQKPDDQPLSRRGSQKPDDQPLSRRGSQKPDDQPLSRRGSQKPDDQPHSRRGSQKPDDQPLSRRGSQKPDDQPLSRRGSQKPDDQPLSRRGSQKPDDQPLSRQGSQKPDDQPLSRRGSQKPDDQPLSRRGSQKPDDQPLSLELDPLELPSPSNVHHPSSFAEVLLDSVLQYISPEPPSDEPVVPEVETTEKHTEARDESPPRRKSLSSSSHWSSSSNVAPEVETIEDLSPEQGSDEAVALEMESTEYYSDTRDESPSRRKSLSARSRRSSSSAGNLDDQPLSHQSSQKPDNQSLSRRGSQKPDDQPLSRQGSQKPDDQPLSRRGSQKPDDQPLSLELDPLELPSTSTVRHPSSVAEVLLDSVLQYISPEPPSDEPVVPEVETTEKHTKARDESPPIRKSLSSSSRWSSSSAVAPEVETIEDLSPEQGSDEAVALEVESTEYYSDTRDESPSRRKSLSAQSRRSSSSAGNLDDQPLSHQSSQKPDDQPLSRRGSQKPDDQPLSRQGSQKPDDQPLSRQGSQKPGDQLLSRRGSQKPDDQLLSRRGSQKPDDQPLSRRGSQKPDDQPVSLELDPLELPSTSTVHHPSSVSEVLLGSIIQYLSSEPPSDETVIPEVEPTDNHTEARDESPPRCKSLTPRSRRSSPNAGNPSNIHQDSQMRNDQPLSVEFDILEVSSTSALRRRSLAAEVLLGPILQYLSSEPPSDETVIPEVETTKNHTEARNEIPPRRQSLSPLSHRSLSSAVVPEVEISECYSDEGDGSPPRRKSLSSSSRWSSSSAVAPEVETIEDLSPEQGSDEAVAFEVESTEYYSDTRDESPSRRKSLSAQSRRSSSSAGNLDDQPLSHQSSQKPDDQPLSRRGSQKPDDQPLSRQGSQKPDDQPLSRRGSQKPDDQPVSLELDPLELPSTSTVHHPSSVSEVLLGSIIQYLSSEPPSDETVIPEVEPTDNHTEARDESPPRCKSLTPRSRRSSPNAGNPSNIHQDSQMRNDQPLSVEFDILEVSSTSALRRRSLAAEVLLGPILQYLSSEPPSDETVIPEVETTKNHTEARNEIPPRRQSLSPLSHRSLSSAVVPEVEISECYSDEGDGSPLRRKSLSTRSRRSSSSGGNAPAPGLTSDNPHNGRRGSQMQDSLEELDTLALLSTRSVRRCSWAVEVLLDPILHYLNPGHSEEADIEKAEIPVVEATEH